MEKVIRNATGVQCTFTDDGIRCETNGKGLYFPYGSITSIKHGFLGLEIQGDGKSFFMATTGRMKADCKEMVAFTQSAMKTAAPAPVEAFDGAVDEDMEELLRLELELDDEDDSSGLHYI